MSETETRIDVFISYKREERDVAQALAEVLEARGYCLWWDADLLPGMRFADEIKAVIERARAAIVLWSERSIASDFVRAEATYAQKQNKLIPVRLDDCDLPLPFNTLHTLDLTGWLGAADEALLEPLFAALEARIGKPSSPPQPPASGDKHTWDAEVPVWRSISEKPEPLAAEYELFLKIYPNGLFAELARMRLATLKKPRPIKLIRNIAFTLASVIITVGAILASITGSFNSWDQIISRFPRLTSIPGWSSSPDQIREPGDTFKDCDECPEMVVIRGDEFKIGSPTGETERDSDEGPQQVVTISTFAIGRYPVTFAEWDACVTAGGCGRYTPSDEGWGRERRPVIHVSWDDADAYVNWLSAETNREYRLPSEAEWEFAARAGKETAYWWGDMFDPTMANTEDGKIMRTTLVGVFRENPWGLHDMSGNVWEWVQDCWHRSYQYIPEDGRAWRAENNVDCERPILRGGSWSWPAKDARSANRWNRNQGIRNHAIGFRVARTFD